MENPVDRPKPPLRFQPYAMELHRIGNVSTLNQDLRTVRFKFTQFTYSPGDSGFAGFVQPFFPFGPRRNLVSGCKNEPCSLCPEQMLRQNQADIAQSAGNKVDPLFT